MPATHPTVDQGGILDFGNKPGRDIIVPDMFLQPAEPATRTGCIDLISQAPQRKQLIRMIG
jgi:hypothetical protein